MCVPPQPDSNGGIGGSRRTFLVVVGIAVVVAAALVAGSLLLRGGDDDGGNASSTTTAVVDGIPQSGTVLGDPNAKVTLLLYEDVQCPFCKQFTDDLLPAVIDEYVRTGKLKIDYRGVDFLDRGEPADSNRGLRAILAAANQGKAWQMAEGLFANQGEEFSGWLTEDLLDEVAGSIEGLDVEQLKADAQSSEIERQIEGLRGEAGTSGVEGTPWFLIKIGSAEPYEVRPQTFTIEAFRPILDDALASG
jgi:protein-disulfide isomerase